MNTPASSKNVLIRYESELIRNFRDLVTRDPDLRWHVPSGGSHHQPDRVELELDDRRFPFTPVFELKPSIPWLEGLAGRRDAATPPLLVTPELTSRVLDHCKRHGIAALDLNGRAWLRASGLLVDRRALPGRSFRYELEPRNIFVGKSARIVRSLLTDRDRVWTQVEIVPRSGASSGLVSRIVQHLISQGFVEKTSPREFRLSEPLALLDTWVAADAFDKRTHTARFSTFAATPVDLAHRLQEWAQRQSIAIAFTQWVAAWVRKPYSEPVVCSAYLPQLPDSATLDQLGLRPVEDGGKLWLHVPDDEGLLRETQTCQGLTLVTDAQIYLDLQRTGLRGPDAATALRDWEGFCRP